MSTPEMEYEAALSARTGAPTPTRRPSLDTTLRAMQWRYGDLREAHNEHVAWSEKLRDQARARFRAHDETLRTHLDIATELMNHVQQLGALVEVLIRTLAVDSNLDEERLYAAAATLHDLRRGDRPTPGFRSFLDEPGVREAVE